MQRLKSRSKQIPNGFTYRMPAIRWDSRKVLGMHPSFDTLVSAVISARRANPHQAAEQKWSLDRNVVGDEVEAYNVKVCLSMGWTSYLTDIGGGAPPPFQSTVSPHDQSLLDAAAVKARQIFTGVQAITVWQKEGAKAVPGQQSESRAAVCVACPLNGQGDFSKWFTAPAAAAIRRQVEWSTGQNLRTSHDDKLNICEACLCAMRLKVHVPLKYIKMGLTDAVIGELRKGNNCWIISELQA